MWFNGGELLVTPDAFGHWQASYSDYPDPFLPWNNGDVTSWDGDEDATIYRINMGTVYTWPEGNNVVRDGCTYGRIYSLFIHDQSTGEDYIDEGQCLLNQSGTNTAIDFQLPGSILEPGDLITVFSGHDVRTLTITPKGTINFDTVNDVISGKNLPYSYIDVIPGGPWENVRTIKTGDDGSWLVKSFRSRSTRRANCGYLSRLGWRYPTI